MATISRRAGKVSPSPTLAITAKAKAMQAEGIDVVKDPLKAKKNVSFVSENVMLYGNFSAVQNLDYFSRLAGKRTLTKKDYADVLSRVGLQKDAFDKRIKNFSKGMRQKLGIAIALLKDAPNVLLDEPTSGLDPQSGREFLEILVQMRDAGKSVFMSTHDIFRAKFMADRIGFMRKGRLVMLKTAKELEHEDLTELYIQYMEEPPAAPAAG